MSVYAEAFTTILVALISMVRESLQSNVPPFRDQDTHLAVAPVLSLLSILETVTIDSVTLTAVSGATTIFTVEKTFDPALQVPINGSVSSGVFTNVPLTQGSAATLSAVNSGTLTANGQFNTQSVLSPGTRSNDIH